jgi:hypothetical protein
MPSRRRKEQRSLSVQQEAFQLREFACSLPPALKKGPAKRGQVEGRRQREKMRRQ